MYTQANYVENGLVIEKPRGQLEVDYKFILPAFTGDSWKGRIVKGKHYFTSFESLKELYPHPQDILPSQANEMFVNKHFLALDEEPSKRKRKPNRNLEYPDEQSPPKAKKQTSSKPLSSSTQVESRAETQRNIILHTENSGFIPSSDSDLDSDFEDLNDESDQDGDDGAYDDDFVRPDRLSKIKPYIGHVEETSASADITASVVKSLPVNLNPATIKEDEVLYAGRPMIKNEVIVNAKRPVEVFLQLLTESFWLKVEKYTNKYRRAKYPRIKPVTASEILHYVGLLLVHSVEGRAGGFRRNWTQNPGVPFSPGLFGYVMPRKRWYEINKCINFYSQDESGSSSSDKFFKTRLLLEELNLNAERSFELGTYCSFDEGTIPSKSTRMPSKQFNPRKPHKWGLKLFMLCCAETGFCTKFELYQNLGKENEVKAGPNALLRNVKHLANSKRVIVCDRYYTSVILFFQLLSIGIYAVGTILTNRVGFSSEIVLKKSTKVTRGFVKTASISIPSIGTISQIAWKDCKPVHMISTGLSTQHCIIERKVKGQRQKQSFNALYPHQVYQQKMGGVDENDFLRCA